MADVAELLRTALEHHQAGRRAEAEPLYRRILEVEPRHADAWHLLGVLALEAGRLDRAVEEIGRAVAIDPTQASYHFNLGEVHRALGRLDEAGACYAQALRLKPDHASAHNNLGTILRQRGDPAGAEACFRRAVAARPDYAIALNNLGTALLSRGELDEARACLERALRLRPDYPEAHNGLGAVLQRQGRLDEARGRFEHALKLRPGYASAEYNLGTLLHAEGKLAEAEARFREALRLKPDFAEAYSQWGAVLKDALRFDDARACFEQALRIRPDDVEALGMLANVLQLQGRVDEARAVLGRALAAAPTDALELRSALLLPVVYESAEQMRRERHRLEQALGALEGRDLAIDDPAHSVGATAFFLAYQGENDRDVLARLAALYGRAAPELAYVAPHCRPGEAGAWAGPGPRIRVGFLSSFFYSHTVGKLNLGYLRNLARDRFEVVVLRPPGHDDALARSINEAADRVVTLPRGLAEARRRVADERLDLLYYADMGMDVWTYFLAFARLAPVQCLTWGQSVTSGLPTIDYYLSGALMEPEDADAHYTETLVRMGRVNTYYYEPRLPAPAKTREAFGLDPGRRLYVCTQSLYKMHPEFDAALGAILRDDPLGEAVLLSGLHPHWAEVLAARFRRTIPEQAGRVRFLPQQSQDDFLHLQALADVLLDTFHFGGCNTCYEAFAFGTPVVTLPGRFLRGRFTQAFYRQMGVLDCIARDPDDYVRIAVRLGTDRAWRDEVRARILASKHRLYEDAEAVRELERFLVAAVERARAGLPPGRLG